MIPYKKVFNRSLPLFIYEIWAKGEREMLPKICEGAFFCEPLFWYQSGLGTGVYYNWIDGNQDPANLVAYFNEHVASYRALVDPFLLRVEQIKEVITRKNPQDIENLLELLLAAWPMFAVCSLFGAWDRDPALCEEIGEGCRILRERTDSVLYEAIEALRSMVALRCGEANADILSLQEVLESRVLSHDDCANRMKEYVYFKNQIFSPVNIGAFLREQKITLEGAQYFPDDTFIGQAACKGMYRGKVKVVFERDQLLKVEKGDVLVAPMTTPDFLSAIRLAGALVTDEGGITCHAAIVARELQKPCVIGTRIATQALKDGDEVEVDAERGTVKILNRV